MSVSLSKGQKVDLTKNNKGLKEILVGLGWDASQNTKATGLKGLFGGSKPNNAIDCDASVFLIDTSTGKIKSMEDVIYFKNLAHSTGAVRHLGDNLTGAGDGDDEKIIVDLSKISANHNRLIFVANIYDAISRKQNFGMIKNAYIRIVDKNTNEEICRYNLSENYDGYTSMIFGEIYLHGSEWKFDAVGSGTTDENLAQLIKRYS